ncbi:unnamed protein product [Protopolystoma xenopodis]|uniref:Uncharacterized protein n=1 Tax=Protopolystoma xenopodis TaxID=117903 RepID=A0A3S5AP64_9PLAT|nr:unnamed protein product [Protopolystoma xenopodis]
MADYFAGLCQDLPRWSLEDRGVALQPYQFIVESPRQTFNVEPAKPVLGHRATGKKTSSQICFYKKSLQSFVNNKNQPKRQKENVKIGMLHAIKSVPPFPQRTLCAHSDCQFFEQVGQMASAESGQNDTLPTERRILCLNQVKATTKSDSRRRHFRTNMVPVVSLPEESLDQRILGELVKRVYNLRKLNELPWHLAWSGRLYEFHSEITFNYTFLASRLQATSW